MNEVQQTSFGFYCVKKPAGPLGSFSQVYLLIEKVVDDIVMQTASFESLLSLSVDNFKELTPNPQSVRWAAYYNKKRVSGILVAQHFGLLGCTPPPLCSISTS